jgi:hypothetical protein
MAVRTALLCAALVAGGCGRIEYDPQLHDVGAEDSGEHGGFDSGAIEGGSPAGGDAAFDGGNPAGGDAAFDGQTAADGALDPDASTECASGCPPCTVGDPLTAFEQQLLDLPQQTWFEAPSTMMRPVCAPDTLGVRGLSGCLAVVYANSGGAYDSARRRMILWGGGHEDYWGNELYGFDLRTGTWSRVTEPSIVPDGVLSQDFFSRDPLPDGLPVPRSTFDGIEFLEDLGQLWAHGGTRARDGNATGLVWVFDAASGWSERASNAGTYQLASAYHAPSRQVLTNNSSGLDVYDVDADRWTSLPGWGARPLWPRYALGGARTAVIDSRRGLYWMVGSGNILVWDIANARAVTDDWVTTGGGDYTNAGRFDTTVYPEQLFESGGGDIYNASAPGIDYDSASDSLVAWPNRGAPYILNLETKEWSVGSSDGAPTSRTVGGTYGRFRYLAAYNVFILINSVDENVYFYKHTAGCGP